MAGPCVWVAVMACVYRYVVAAPTTTVPPQQPLDVSSSLQDFVSSLRQVTPILQDMRDIMQEYKPPTTPGRGGIIEEGEPQRPRHCQDLLQEGDTGQGVRRVYPFPGQPHEVAHVYCDHTLDGGGWTIIQHRDNLTTREDFYRTWVEYQLGFGHLTGEFWLGLNLLHILTSSSLQQLRVDLADFEGDHRWAKYGVFNVAAPKDNYRLSIGRYSGNAGNSMNAHNGAQFTTYDADHDNSDATNCAVKYKGAWWHDSCHDSNLNGYQYEGQHDSFADGINWAGWKGFNYSLMTTTLMIKPAF